MEVSCACSREKFVGINVINLYIKQMLKIIISVVTRPMLDMLIFTISIFIWNKTGAYHYHR